MASSSVLKDIRDDLDGLPGELIADVKKLIDDASPAVTSAVKDARSRGAAVGSTLVAHVPDNVMDRVPDPITDRLPGASSGGSKLKKLLLVGGVAALAAAGIAAWKARSAGTSSSSLGAHANSAAPSPNGHRATGPQSLEQDIAEQPGQYPH